MTEPDKTIIDPVAKLMSYGLPEWQIKDCKKILQEALTPEDVTSRLRKDHSTCDKSQLLMPLFAPLYQNDLDIRNKVQSELATTGISSDIIYVYILSSKRNGTLYIGVTNNLIKRVYEHKNDLVEGFTKQYQIHNLVYFEPYENINEAIVREKQIKEWKRY